MLIAPTFASERVCMSGKKYTQWCVIPSADLASAVHVKCVTDEILGQLPGRIAALGRRLRDGHLWHCGFRSTVDVFSKAAIEATATAALLHTLPLSLRLDQPSIDALL